MCSFPRICPNSRRRGWGVFFVACWRLPASGSSVRIFNKFPQSEPRPMTREEIELLSGISKRLVEEKDPDQFTNLERELEKLLDKIDQNGQIHAPKYPTAA